MKPETSSYRWTSIAFAAVLCAAGCATDSGSGGGAAPASNASGGSGMRKDKDIQQVWLAEGFNFKGYDVLCVTDTLATAKPHNKEEEPLMEWAKGAIRDQLATEIRVIGIIPTVVTSPSDIKPGARALVMQNTIVEYEKGGGGARYFAGLYGAGQPKLKIQGTMREGDKTVFKYEAFRSGESGSARMFGGFRSDRDIQQEDINDFTHDMADFIRRTATGQAK